MDRQINRAVQRGLVGALFQSAFALASCGGGTDHGNETSAEAAGATEPAPIPGVEAAAQTPAPVVAESRSPEASLAPAANTDEEVNLIRGNRRLMSTVYQITVVSGDELGAYAAIDAALDEVERLGVVLSEWVPESEVSRINAAAGREAIPVGPDTMANIDASIEVAEWTHGAFDLTWAAIREFYLFQQGRERVPDLARVRERLPLVNYRDVVVDHDANTVMLRREGMAIGLGGIAKGYAVDRASAILRERGFSDFMIFGGGQVLVHGMRGDRRWRVGIQHPRTSDYIGFVETTNASIATSGDYEHFFIAADGARWHHIIDLSTGEPARGATSVTIIAPTGLLADGIDTGCFIMGAEACLSMLESIEPQVEAVIIDADFRVWMTPGIREQIVMRVELDEESRLPRDLQE